MQFIPRLSSTSINNKHLHKTRASLRGWRRHRPARSTSDEVTLKKPSVCSARTVYCVCFPHDLSSVTETPAQSLLMPSRTYQSCSFISSDRDVSVLMVVAESIWGSWQETDALVQDSSVSLMRPVSFHQLALRHEIDVWCSARDMTWCRGGRMGLLTHKYCVWW